jgi:prepilin-type N-terminal cleavage/methylation domain-containing protein
VKTPHKLLLGHFNSERGMSLIEVVVAISILGVLATATLGFLISSMNATSTIQHRSLAVTVASESMENVSAWTASALTTGRSASAVTAQWAGATAPGLANTYPAFDPSATTPSTSVPALPLARTVTLSGTDFVARIFIGTCYQATSGGSCARLPSLTTPPAMTPAGYAALKRVIVEVTWTASVGCDTSADCSYSTATLIDPNADLEWKVND